jgi:hypothetical protein
VTDIWPGELTEIIPAHMQVQVEVLSRAGMPPICTFSEPGAHGLTTAGMHGCGVRTPSAALVAAATCGFAIDMHIPKVGMFAGVKSATVPTGVPAVTIIPVAAKVAGIAPKLQVSCAPVQTSAPIFVPLSFAERESYRGLDDVLRRLANPVASASRMTVDLSGDTQTVPSPAMPRKR